MLTSVFRHRYLSADHIHELHFRGSGLRVCQARLKLLWAAALLDRTYLTPEVPDVRDRYTERPLYSLARRGGDVVSEHLGIDLARIPHTPAQNRDGYRRIRHNLAVTDLLVAAEAACSRAPSWTAVATREDAFRRQLDERRGSGPVAHALVPDGAVTATSSGQPLPQTYLIEVVRAGVKAGNDTIRRRLHRYRAALRAGFFRDVYRFAWVRCVVFLTPTLRRAEHLARLAKDVVGAENLFRFGAYEHRVGTATPTSCLSPASLTSQQWLTPSGRRVALIPELSIISNNNHV